MTTMGAVAVTPSLFSDGPRIRAAVRQSGEGLGSYRRGASYAARRSAYLEDV
jgi:hypothetical protein